LFCLKKVAIIEIGGSHGECLYSQIQFLKEKDMEVTLICSSNLKNTVSHLKQVNQFQFVDYEKGEWKGALAVRQIINKSHFDAIVINTAHGKRIRNILLFPFSKKQNFTGIAHNAKKFAKSNTQTIINRKIKKYFFLAEYLLQNKESLLATRLSFDYFYPIFFPELLINKLPKPKEEIWICIPGQVEYKRRDYKTLFEQIEKSGLSPNIKLIFLGKSKHKHGDGEAIQQEIERLGIKNQCVHWDGFVDTNTFETYMKQCDYLLPLIHQDKPELSNYFTNQISGTFNLAFGYNKPLLLEESFQDYPDFKVDGEFYKTDDLVSNLNNLEIKKKEIYTSERFTFKEQRRRYLELVYK